MGGILRGVVSDREILVRASFQRQTLCLGLYVHSNYSLSVRLGVGSATAISERPPDGDIQSVSPVTLVGERWSTRAYSSMWGAGVFGVRGVWVKGSSPLSVPAWCLREGA